MSKHNYKNKQKNLCDQYLQEISCHKVLSDAYKSIRDGYKKADDYIIQHPYEFLRKTSISDKYNSKIVAEFCQRIYSDFRMSSRIFHFTTRNMIYFLLDDKILFCIKAMDQKDRIKNRDSKRYKNVMEGYPVSMNKEVIEVLEKRRIVKQPPIYYIGYFLSKNEGLRIKCIRYENNDIAFSLDLKEIFFKEEIDILVKNKKEISKNIKVV